MTLRAGTLRHLTVANPAPGRAPHLSAGSGLARVGDRIYVVADDELALGEFSLSGGREAPGRLRPFVDELLPLGHTERKARKPDLEALVHVPGPGRADAEEDTSAGFGAFAPHGALLALGSGGRPTRMRGFLWALGPDGGLAGQAEAVDLASLYAALAQEIADLNIEGAAARPGRLTLLHRGNAAGGRNVTIDLDLEGVRRALASSQPALQPNLLIGTADHDLGAIDGVPLCFTDASPLSDGSLVFTAAAERTDDPYLDGACAGSAVGVIDAGGSVVRITPMADQSLKLEGVHATVAEAGGIEVLLVADPDDVSVASPLMAATLSPR